MKQFSILFLACVSSGCFGTFHTATPIPVNTVEIGIIPGTVIEMADGPLLPSSEIAVRVGIAESLDLGIQTNFVGALFDANFALILTDRFALSINPAVGILVVPTFWNAPQYPADESFSSRHHDTTIALASFALLIDVLKSKSRSLTIGLKPTVALAVRESEPDLFFTGMVGTKLCVTNDVSIMPMVEGISPMMHNSDAALLRLNLGIFF